MTKPDGSKASDGAPTHLAGVSKPLASSHRVTSFTLQRFLDTPLSNIELLAVGSSTTKPPATSTPITKVENANSAKSSITVGRAERDSMQSLTTSFAAMEESWNVLEAEIDKENESCAKVSEMVAKLLGNGTKKEEK